MIPPGTPIPSEAVLIVLPGSKAVIADMAFLREEGWDIDILAHHRRGGAGFGICGGYQLLGKRIADPLGIEGPVADIAGLGLLDVETTISERKTLRRTAGEALGTGLSGYEIHIGVTDGSDAAQRPFARLDGVRPDGALSRDGQVIGTYCHGLLQAAAFRGALLARLGAAGKEFDQRAIIDAALEEIAGMLEQHLDVDGLIELARTV